MKIEKEEYGWKFVAKERELAKFYYEKKKLYLVDGDFIWLAENEAAKFTQAILITAVEDIYGEEQMDFCDEYLLDFGNDERCFFWED